MKLFGTVGKTLSLVAFVAILAGCSSDSDDGATSGGSSTTTESGVFIDSLVEGLDYSCTASGLSGVTDAEGKFSYKAGDECTFSVGDIVLGSAVAKGVVTPLDLLSQFTLEELANLLVFLQSLDSNQDLSDGIQIPEGLTGALGVEFTGDVGDFKTALAAWLPADLTVADADAALAHFYDSTDEYFNTPLTEEMFNNKIFKARGDMQFILQSDTLAYEQILFRTLDQSVGTGSWSVADTKLTLTQSEWNYNPDVDVIEFDFMTTPATGVWYRVKTGTAEPYNYQFGKIDSMGTASIPVAPSGLTTAGVTPNLIDFAWIDNSDSELSIEIKYSTRADAEGWARKTFIANTVEGFTPNLQPETEYFFKLSAANLMGKSEYSDILSVTTPPIAPSVPTAVNFTSTTTSIDVSWTKSTGTVDKYVLAYSADSSFPISPREATTYVDITSGTSYLFKSLPENAVLYVKVKAVNAGGSSAYTAPEEVQTTPLLPTPANFDVDTIYSSTQFLDSTATFSWTKSKGATGYRLEIASDSTFSTILHTVAIPDGTTETITVNYTDEKLTTNDTYTRIKATNSTSYSAYAETVVHFTK